MELTRKAGEKVLPLLKRAKEELTVYSPYISPEYAELLVEKSENGADVTVFTAKPDADYHRRSLQILREGPRPPKTMRNVGLLLISLGAVGALIACCLALLALIPSALLFAGGGYLLKKHSERADGWLNSHGEIDVRVVGNLHAKLYSRDNGEEAIFGSPNLTKSGMWRNLEVIGGCHDKPPFREGRSGVAYA
ncbi:hypothetical protein AKJ43_02170 [candidate division MSBL1 archaeon SCGC-AAA261D19]|uniref:Phospholipase D-like domain-containing protein n=1 Tax=candidate division MSBL1 archaeon SCGC-AAA261D19 TaxID=1698273 RepID=A0A133V708_9EURY|nr:hypothetical protein AKJ43_02170 [candidate division MSBL1 archaeon SCGC-AAA261D19]